MLNTPTLERLEALGLTGMAAALREQLASRDIEHLGFDDRLGLMVDREATERADRRLRYRLKQARLRISAAVADIDYRSKRGLDKRMVLALASCQWVKQHQNLIITGPTGVGKSYVGCAFAHAACLEGYSVAYHRLPRLLEELQLAHGDGRYLKLTRQLAHVDVLLLDDWGLNRLTTPQQSDLLEIIDERHERRSTIVTSQLPVDHWHQAMADPTLADAIVDRLVHNAHHITLKGESMRKRAADLDLDSKGGK
jgi:DNA replication protein DnaC